MKKVVVERASRVFDDVFAIDEAWVSFEKLDGTMSASQRRLVFERGDSVAALLHDREADRFVLVRQFRYPTHAKGPGWILETVAGVVDEGETPEETVRREVEEESGYQVHALEHVSTFYTSPGGSSERIHLYYAAVGATDRVGDGGGVASEGEDIEIVDVAAHELPRMIERGELADAKTLIAVLWWLRRGEST